MAIFQKATKKKSRLRLALCGPSGAGKTYSALSIAAGLGGRIGVIDTEHGTASKYSHKFSFEEVSLDTYDPRLYIDMIQAAEAEGFDVLIIDSLSHAWAGKGGALEIVDNAAKRSNSGNTFAAWRNVTPIHNALVDAILTSRCHIIATMRSKVDYVMEADPRTGRLTPRKVGMAPIQREGMDYEFDVVGDINLDHDLIVGKTRCELLDGKVFPRPGREFAGILTAWLTDGAEAFAVPAGGLPVEMVASLRRLLREAGMTDHQERTALARRGVSSLERLTAEQAQEMINNLEHVVSRMAFAEQIGTGPTPPVAETTGEQAAQPGQPDDSADADTDNHMISSEATRAARD